MAVSIKPDSPRGSCPFHMYGNCLLSKFQKFTEFKMMLSLHGGTHVRQESSVTVLCHRTRQIASRPHV